jgi:Asp-tRNA(Asn)/Glu-tRNA(Gln) amidotransferase A subunit family amidase
MPSVPDLAEALRGLADGSLTSVALVERALARAAETEPRIHAFAWLDRARALGLARDSDARRAGGSARSGLDGVPIGVKDIFDTAGIPTENGSALYRGRVPKRSATAVVALEAAGAVVLGKTVTTELAFMTPGVTRNPWNTAHTPGGSSMGSAAAVAAGVLCAAVGSQTNGSVIRPAAFCGVVGFKPSVFRLPKDGMLEFSRTLDQVGVFARSVEGAALLAATIAGQPADRWWRPAGGAPRFVALRTSEWEHATDPARDRFQADVDRLAAAGGPVEWPQPPKGLDDAPRVLRTVMLYEAAQVLLATVEAHPEEVSAYAREALADGARMSERAYREALAERREIAAAFGAWAARYDAVLTPPAIGEAPGPETTGDPRFCSRWSLVGAPAITIPTGLGPNGLPLGLQLVGAPDDDARVLGAAAWAEAHLTSPGAPPI